MSIIKYQYWFSQGVMQQFYLCDLLTKNTLIHVCAQIVHYVRHSIWQSEIGNLVQNLIEMLKMNFQAWNGSWWTYPNNYPK